MVIDSAECRWADATRPRARQSRKPGHRPSSLYGLFADFDRHPFVPGDAGSDAASGSEQLPVDGAWRRVSARAFMVVSFTSVNTSTSAGSGPAREASRAGAISSWRTIGTVCVGKRSARIELAARPMARGGDRERQSRPGMEVGERPHITTGRDDGFGCDAACGLALVLVSRMPASFATQSRMCIGFRCTGSDLVERKIRAAADRGQHDGNVGAPAKASIEPRPAPGSNIEGNDGAVEACPSSTPRALRPRVHRSRTDAPAFRRASTMARRPKDRRDKETPVFHCAHRRVVRPHHRENPSLEPWSVTCLKMLGIKMPFAVSIVHDHPLETVGHPLAPSLYVRLFLSF